MASGPAKTAVKEPNDWQTVPADDWQNVDGGQTQSTAPPESEGLEPMARDFVRGAGKGALSTLNGIGSLIVPDRALKLLGEDPAAENAKAAKMTAPTNTAQSIGKGVEQGAEFLIPGMGEEAATADVGKLAPKLKPLARIGYDALTSGAVNKAQGGDFGTGALMGGGTRAFGEGMKLAAPTLTEAALRVSKGDRVGGREIGKSVLSETQGVRPATIAKSAANRVKGLTADSVAKAGPNARFDLAGPRQAGIDAMKDIESQNVPAMVDAGRDLQDVLNTRYATGQPIPQDVPFAEGMSLRRGLGKYLPPATWSPETANRMAPMRNRMYGAMNEEIGKQFPAIRENDKIISNLVPAEKAAESVSRNASLGQRVAGRVAAHTGAATLGGLGALEGYREGGPTRALEYGLAGVLGPELMSEPTVQMMAARTLNSRVPAATTRAIAGGAMSAKRQRQRETDQN